MKTIYIAAGIGALLASLAFGVSAYEPITFGNDSSSSSSSTSISGFGSSSNQSGYESSSGNRYQYDLSDPSDSMDYDMDSSAQMRDQMNVDPGVDMDRSMGEYGGGIYD